MKFNIKDIYELLKKQNFSQAETILIKLIKSNKNNKEYLFLRGIIFAQKKLFKEAIECFEKTLDNKQFNYDAHFNIGNCLIGMQEYYQAIDYFKVCSKINSAKFEPFQKIGLCFRNLGKYDQSNSYLDESLKINKNPTTYLLQANNRREIGDFLHAKILIENLFEYDHDNIDGLLLLANINMDQSLFGQAKSNLDKVIRHAKTNRIQHIAAQIDMGNLYKLQGKYGEAIDLYNKILRKDPNNASASYNLSLCYLFLKKYDLAWIFHEKRMQLNIFGNLRQRVSILKKPLWDSSKSTDNILIWGEQGIGDTILYSQYLQAIEDVFKKIILAVDEKLIGFFEKIFKNIEIKSIKELDFIQGYDHHLPMGSLGFHFHKLLDTKKITQNFYYSHEDTRIPKKIKKIRCAISWQSVNKLFGHKKSIPLIKFKKLFFLNDVEFINIQFKSNHHEVREIESLLNSKVFIEHPVDCFNDIEGTANLIKSCDLVITVSNSNAHIAGKLDTKTCLLLPYSDGKLWYWGTNSDENIDWYPSLIPIRQKEPDHWDDCIDQVYEKLEKML